MNKTISSSKSIITIVVLAILIFGSVFAYQYYYPQKEIVQTPNLLNEQNIQNPEEAEENNVITDYELFAKDAPTLPTKYIDDGLISSGPYSGYHRIVALQITGEMYSGISYYLFATKNYKEFYFDPKFEGYFPKKLSDFDRTKVIGEFPNIPTNHPETISLGNLILIRQDDYYGNFDQFGIGDDAKELSTDVPELRFFVEEPASGEASNIFSDYTSSKTEIKAIDEHGLIFYYLLVSREYYERELEIERLRATQKGYYTENYFYSKTDFKSDFSAYNYYGMPFPGACGSITSSGYILKNISINDLTLVGTTSKGVQLYTLVNKNHPLNQYAYKSKITNVYESSYSSARAEAEKLNNNTPQPTYEEYVAQNPLLIFKDPWGRWVILGEHQFLLMGGCGKPVVYLYPEKPTEVRVVLEKPIRFDIDIPTYKNSWNVLASPDGLLKDLNPQDTNCSTINTEAFGSEYSADACKNNLYPYLYWAGQVNGPYPQANSGWVVAKENLALFIEEKLTIIGLNKKEISDMLEYWVPELTAKSSPYYRISFFQTADMNLFIPMSITPKPDTLIRVFLDWSPLAENNIDIEPQTLIHIERKGFTAVEWGGLKQ
ncbi:hypothetical protein KKA24_01050 [Patescibacteria group bacterium]|nr:hypothetical protein [Patescibacteria group bacterium]